MRFDLGDTMIFASARDFVTIIQETGGPDPRQFNLGGETTHNIQFSFGFGILF